MNELLEAMQKYQKNYRPWELVTVRLFSDGSGEIWVNGDMSIPFANPHEAVEKLNGEG